MMVAGTFAAAVVLSFAADALAVPRVSWRRPPAALGLHVATVMFVGSLSLLVTARPMFSAFVALALSGLLAAVSNAKYESLREPFVFTDLSLFSQLFAHPRLYLPFLSAGTVAAVAAGGAALAGGFLAETPVAPRPFHAAVIMACLCLACAYWLAAQLPLSLDPVQDQARHGFIAVFVAYLLNGLRPATLRAFERAAQAGPFAADGVSSARPDVIVIQSESFFDVRRLGAAIDPSVLAHFDTARRESVAFGALTVPAWGANTMRTEFAMLTGLPQATLGYARFYPYAFVRRACASIAGRFRRAGYATLAIHPYYADFFGRDRVFPLLQFDRFFDIGHFAHAPRAGPYVADAAVADAIVAELDVQRDAPAFVFAMTMENHGPLHLEAVQPGEAASWHALGDDVRWCDLTIYLRHVANADAMIGRLLEHLRARSRDTVLCYYGDHVPALAHVFGELGVKPVRSDYFIWRNFGVRPAARQDISVEDLGVALLRGIEAGGANDVSADALQTTTQR